MRQPRILDLFSGIGGFSLGAAWAGMTTVDRGMGEYRKVGIQAVSGVPVGVYECCGGDK